VWFDDARREAAPETAGDLHARRREIIFSVVCVESYLVEWAVDLLATRFADADLVDALQSYFPKQSTTIGLWNEVPRRLHEDGYLPKLLGEYTEAHVKDFTRLIDYRNDITHANVSHPDVLSSEPEASRQARTTTTALTELPPGWAMGVVAQRIQQLHRETGTTPPEWSTVPTTGQEDAPS